MTRSEFHAQLHLALDLSQRPDEEPCIAGKMIDLLENTPDCFHRSSFPAHFTGSALVVSA